MVWYLSFDFGSFRVFLALFCAICGLFTPKVEVSGKEGKIPLSCSELFLTKRLKFFSLVNEVYFL